MVKFSIISLDLIWLIFDGTIFMMDQIKTAFEKEDFNKIVTLFRELRLETANNDKTIERILFKLESKKLFDILNELMLKIAQYPLVSLESELKEGLKILVNNKKETEAFEILKTCIENGKNVAEYVLSSFVSSSLRNQTNLENCFELIKLVQTRQSTTNNLSHTFWQEAIEGFSKSKQPKLSIELVKLYPIKFSYSESLWKNFIKANMSNEEVMGIFEILTDKFGKRTIHDEFKSYEIIFNVFLEQISGVMGLIDQSKIDKIFDTIHKLKIVIKESVLEGFLLKIVQNSIDNFERVQNYLIKADCFLTVKILDKIIAQYGKSNENFAIFNILKMCKTKKLPIPFHNLNVDAKVMKNVVQFMLENTNVNFDDSFCDNLSQDNKSYLLNNFSAASRKSSRSKFEEIGVKDQVIAMENSQMEDSKSINSKSFVKIEKSVNEENDFVMIKK